MGNPLVSIIIVHHKNPDLLQDCLKSLRDITYSPVEVIVVDNDSGSPDIEKMVEGLPVVVMRNSENVGFAKGCNIGTEAAQGAYLLFLNDDTRVERDFLEKMVDEIERDATIGCCQPKIRIMDRPSHLDSVGSFWTWTGFLNHVGTAEEDRGQYDHITDIFSPKGACMFMGAQIFREVGMFDEDYFAYFEETDLAWRIWLSGLRVVMVKDSIIFHKMLATTSSLNYAFILYHSNKNRICSYIKNLESRNLLFVLMVQVPAALLLSLTFLVSLRTQKAVSMLRALGWNMVNLRETFRKRKFIQKEVRKVKDAEIFARLSRMVPWKGFVQHLKLVIDFEGKDDR